MVRILLQMAYTHTLEGERQSQTASVTLLPHWAISHLGPLLSYWNLNNLLHVFAADLLKSWQSVTCIPCQAFELSTTCCLHPLLSHWNLKSVTCAASWTIELLTICVHLHSLICHLHTLLSYWTLNNLPLASSIELLKPEQSATCILYWAIGLLTICVHLQTIQLVWCNGKTDR